MRMKGGNTDELYKYGTEEKSRMLQCLHPDVTELTWKFGRIHHEVNYRGFTQQLKVDPEARFEDVGGMQLVDKRSGDWR